MKTDGTFETLSKRERLLKTRQKDKLEKNLGSIADLTRIPAAIFVVDVMKEHIAVAEALKLNIPIFAMVDTNSDPRKINFPIPANDDASKSIDLVMSHVMGAITEGLSERKAAKDGQKAQEEKAAPAEEKAAE